MKNFFVVSGKAALVIFLCAVLCLSCKKEGSSSANVLDKDASYAFGMYMAAQSQMSGIGFDYDSLKEGFRDYIEARETRFSMEQGMEKIVNALTSFRAQQEEEMWLLGEQNREEGEAFQAENRARSGVSVTASGLQYEVLTQGDGEKPGPTDMVDVHYEGSFIDGNVFDSSYIQGEAVVFPLDGGVIPGWAEGLGMMREGSRAMLYLPPELAYGEMSIGNIIAPNTVLIFEVELLEIIR